MNADVKDTHPIDTQASELLGKLLSGDRKGLSEQDKVLLTENRKAIIQHLQAIFSKEIPLLLKEGKCLDAPTLYWGLKLAGFLEASETFQWTEKLCHLSIEELNSSLGEYFATEELSYLLADTMNQWHVLKDVIEDPDVDEYIRSVCLDALVLSVVKNHVDRLEITDYFKSLFLRILNGEFEDDRFCTHLASSCASLWPGECLEEIKESFGLNLVDETHLDIDFVLEKFSQGKESCIEKLQEQLRHHNFEKALLKRPGLFDENQIRSLNRMVQLSNQASAYTDRALKEVNKGSQRNEICECGSGRKYKKCCMNKHSKIFIEESVISYGPLEESEAVKALPEEVKESIFALHPLLEENPEEVLQKTCEYISQYPDIPMLYNFLYGAYRNTGHMREAMKLVKETVRIFPDYLFGRIEYAGYLLRRGEPEKAHAALENAGTLSQLYPERKVFHAAEWKAFAHLMGLYWIQKNNINQAKIYLEIIQKIDPDSPQITDLKKKMKCKLYLHFMEKLQKEQEP